MVSFEKNIKWSEVNNDGKTQRRQIEYFTGKMSTIFAEANKYASRDLKHRIDIHSNKTNSNHPK